MVLGQPHGVDAEGLCLIYQGKTLGKGLSLGHPFAAGKLDKEPTVHARLLSNPVCIGCDGTGIHAGVKREGDV